MFLFIISAIEGMTEFLPISSTAHILFFQKLFNIPNITMEYIVTTQLGAISAIFVFYPQKIRIIVSEVIMLKPKLITTLIIITLPTLIIGFVLHILGVFHKIPTFIITINLIIGGIVMLIFAKTEGSSDNILAISTKDAIKIGIFQVFSLIPGVSRSLSVILGGIACNLSRKSAIEISLLSGFPVIFAATFLEIATKPLTNVNLYNLLLHTFVAFVFSCLGVFLMQRLANNRWDFHTFGMYRIIFGMVALFVM